MNFNKNEGIKVILPHAEKSDTSQSLG